MDIFCTYLPPMRCSCSLLGPCCSLLVRPCNAACMQARLRAPLPGGGHHARPPPSIGRERGRARACLRVSVRPKKAAGKKQRERSEQAERREKKRAAGTRAVSARLYTRLRPNSLRAPPARPAAPVKDPSLRPFVPSLRPFHSLPLSHLAADYPLTQLVGKIERATLRSPRSPSVSFFSRASWLVWLDIDIWLI
jgi:hypothetical protein